MELREITVEQLAGRLERGEPTLLVDVREPWEHATASLAGSRLIPLGMLAGQAAELDPPEGALVVVLCHHGMRSLAGAAMLLEAGHEAVSLRGGIDAWSALIDPAVPRY